jgi:hypothetical protein
VSGARKPPLHNKAVILEEGNCNYGAKKIFGRNTRKSFSRFSTKYRCTGKIAHNKEGTTIMKPEWWGSSLVQEGKYQEGAP